MLQVKHGEEREKKLPSVGVSRAAIGLITAPQYIIEELYKTQKGGVFSVFRKPLQLAK